jgi:Trypsin-like peptidase domain
MRLLTFVAVSLLIPIVHADTPAEILARNTRALVYLQVEDAAGGVLDRGTGFIVSHDGYVVTVAHIKVDPTQKIWAVIGQREGTRYPLMFRGADEHWDVALWQLPQSASCRYAVTLGTTPVRVLDRELALGFPGNEGLTPASVSVVNLSSERGFYKSDGFLRVGNSGGPVFNESNQVIAIVQGGALPGTDNNDLIPIAPAIALISKAGVKVGIGTALPFDDACYASCRTPSNGIEKWTTQVSWGPVDTGWLSGGHNQRDECNKVVAAALASDKDSAIELQGTWEESKKDVLGTVQYRYYCKGVLRSRPVYIEKQSSACGLWN